MQGQKGVFVYKNVVAVVGSSRRTVDEAQVEPVNEEEDIEGESNVKGWIQWDRAGVGGWLVGWLVCWEDWVIQRDVKKRTYITLALQVNSLACLQFFICHFETFSLVL